MSNQQAPKERRKLFQKNHFSERILEILAIVNHPQTTEFCMESVLQPGLNCPTQFWAVGLCRNTNVQS